MSKALHQIFAHVRQLLHVVQHRDLFQRQAQSLFELHVRGLRDRRNDRRAEIDRDPIGLLVIQRQSYAFA
jgi:hypothetical protein